MENIILIAVLLAIVGGIVWYLLRTKRRGAGCIGCPCSGKCSGGCSCENRGQNKHHD